MVFNDKSDYFDADSPSVNPVDNVEKPSESSETDRAEVNPVETVEPKEEPKPKHRFRKFMLWVLFIVVLVGAVAFYIRYCNPYVVDARESGLIVNVEKRGILFKTYEAEVSTYASLCDSSTQYTRQKFSFANDSLAHVAQLLQLSGQPVQLTYSRYFATLPWRGASVRVITGIHGGNPVDEAVRQKYLTE